MERARIVSVILAGAAWTVIAAPAETDALAGSVNSVDEELDARAAVMASDASAEGAEAAAPRSHCPADMVEVMGHYCPELEQRCKSWLAPEPDAVERCAEFAPSGPCKAEPVEKHFCIDRYEWPNQRGERPLVMKTWIEAQEACRGAGKRLCVDSEWTLACEGKDHLPYPYGLVRDANACNIDKPLPKVNGKAMADPKTTAAEVARLWQGEVSGARAECTSPYGVYDMTGNVDEWVVNESAKPYRSASKGGYWGPVRARCRPTTTAHGERFPFYQTGFRCCAAPKP